MVASSNFPITHYRGWYLGQRLGVLWASPRTPWTEWDIRLSKPSESKRLRKGESTRMGVAWRRAEQWCSISALVHLRNPEGTSWNLTLPVSLCITAGWGLPRAYISQMMAGHLERVCQCWVTCTDKRRRDWASSSHVALPCILCPLAASVEVPSVQQGRDGVCHASGSKVSVKKMTCIKMNRHLLPVTCALR